MTAVNGNETAALDGVETGSASQRTCSYHPSSPLGAFSSYRLNRLSLKKRPRNEQAVLLFPYVSTADTQAPRYPEAPGRQLVGVAQGLPLSSAAVPQRAFHDEQSSIGVPEPCLESRAGKADRSDAADKSEPCLTKAAGMAGLLDRAPMSTAGLSGARTSGRPPLQAWVPRKRNLASFDALDELSHLTDHKQHPSGGQGSQLTALSHAGPNYQQLSSGLPLRAPKCLPGAQDPALQWVYMPGCSTVPPAESSRGPEGATGPHACGAQKQGWKSSRAPGSSLAASSQVAWLPGTTAPGHRLHHRPFAPPRPNQKPEADNDASARPPASSLAGAGCGSDEDARLGSSAPASPHQTHHCSGKSRATDPVSRGSKSAWDSDGVISDSEASEASDTSPDRQHQGTSPAGVAVIPMASTVSPLKVAPQDVHSSRELQPPALPDGQDAIAQRRAHHAQPVPPAKGPSHCSAETAPPRRAAAAGVAPQHGRTAPSAAGRRLKRLCSGGDEAPVPPHAAGPRKDVEIEDVDGMADKGKLLRQSPSHADLEDKDSQISSEGADSLGAVSLPEQSPAPRLHGSGRGLKRLRRITSISPESSVWGSRHTESKGNSHDESAHTKPAVQGAPKANPFVSAKAAVSQEPRLACHAAPAQPQCNTLNDDPLWGDMDCLLRGPGGQQQALARRSMNGDIEATACGVIDLASDDSAGAGEDRADPPARPPHRRICLPGMPTSPRRRTSQGRQPSNRSYLGAYSSADIMPEPAKPGKAQTLPGEAAAAQSDASLDRAWLGSGEVEKEHSRRKGIHEVAPEASLGFCPGSIQRGPLLGDQQNRQPNGPGTQQYRAQSGLGEGSAAGARSDASLEAAGASRLPRHGAPWWHRLEDFVPVAAIRDGRDPRVGSRVFIDYRAQFSGEKHPTPAGGGFQQAKRGRKTQQTPSAPRPAEAARAEGSCAAHWLTTHQHGRRRKVYVTAGGRKQLTGAAAHAAYERDKRATGSFVKDS